MKAETDTKLKHSAGWFIVGFLSAGFGVGAFFGGSYARVSHGWAVAVISFAALVFGLFALAIGVAIDKYLPSGQKPRYPSNGPKG